jgi:hypothetical protein
VAPDHVGGVGEVAGGQEVRERVVVDQRRVLVRSGHPVDAEATLGIVVPERGPQPGGVHDQVEADRPLEVAVVRGRQVAADGVGHVRVDVEGGRPRRPVGRALLAADRPPREHRAGEVQGRRARLRGRQGGVAPVEGVAHRAGSDVGQRGQDVGLGVPERVAVVAPTRQALGRDGAALGTPGRLHELEDGEADRELELRVAVELHVGAGPQVGEVGALALGQAVPAGPLGRRQRGVDLVAQRRHGSLARPPVGEVLDEVQGLAGFQLRAHGDACEVVLALRRDHRPVRTVDVVVEGGGDAQAAPLGAMSQRHLEVVVGVVLRHERRAQRGGRPGIGRALDGGLVDDQGRLHDDPGRRPDRLDRVRHGGHRALDERDEPRRAHPHALTGGRRPLHRPVQDPVAQVERPLVADQGPLADVEGLVVDEQSDQLAVRDVEERLALFRVPVTRLGVRQGHALVEPVQVRAGITVRLALVEVAPQADVPVGQGEDRLGLHQVIEPQCTLAERPRPDRQHVGFDHPSSSAGGRPVRARTAPAGSLGDASGSGPGIRTGGAGAVPG